MRYRIWGVVVLGCVVSAPVWAQGEDKEVKEFKAKNTQSYVMISGGRSTTPAACDARWLQASVCGSKGTVYRVGYGYNFNSLLAMEVSYGDFARVKETGTDPAPPAWASSTGVAPLDYYRTWSATGWELAAVGTIHLGPYISLHGKAGWVHATIDEEVMYLAVADNQSSRYSEVHNSTSASGGIQIDFNRDVGVRFQVNRYNKLGNAYKYKATSVLASLVMKF